jgi:competence protein ComEC
LTHGPEISMTVLDVGQGLAVALRLPGGFSLLFDAGPRWRDYDAGERVVVPALRRLGVARLDLLAISHRHPDHAGGAGAVRRELDPRLVWVGGGGLVRGAERTLPGGVGVRVLNPAGGDDGGVEENDRSLALLLVRGGSGVVLAGDAGPGVVDGLATAVAPAPPHVALQAPHHGGSAEACGRLAMALAPEISVVSVGRNGYGHPRAGAVAALEASGRVLRTDRDGAVFVTGDGGPLRVRTWRELAAGRTWPERLRWLVAGW